MALPATQPTSDDAAVTALAKQTKTPFDVVKNLYDREMGTLRAEASVTRFLGVIASRRVKRQLWELSRAP